MGAVSFVAAPMRLGPRDQHLGWEERERESQRWRQGLRQGFELSRACPDQPIVVAGDRESDLYGLFRERKRREQAGEENVELLVHLHLGRRRKVNLWDQGLRSLMLRSIPMEADLRQRVRFRRQYGLTSQGGQRARQRRKVETRVSLGPVEVQPPEAPPAGRVGSGGQAGA